MNENSLSLMSYCIERFNILILISEVKSLARLGSRPKADFVFRGCSPWLLVSSNHKNSVFLRYYNNYYSEPKISLIDLTDVLIRCNLILENKFTLYK